MLRAAFALIALCVSLSLVAAQPPTPAVTMDDIKKAWQERQDKVKTLKMSWTRELAMPKGALDSLIGRRDAVKPPQPPRDMRFGGRADFSLRDGSYRLATKYETWSLKKAAATTFDLIYTYDGEKHYEYYPDPSPGTPSTASRSPKTEVRPEQVAVEYYPVWWIFRGTDPKLGRAILETYECTNRSVMIGGHECAEVRHRAVASDAVTSIYLDAARGFLPVRYTHRIQNRLAVVLEIDYSPTGLPSSWRYTLQPEPKQMSESCRCIVTSCDANTAVSAEELGPGLAPGTLLIDRMERAEKRTVIQPDGGEGTLLPDDPRRTYEEIAKAAKPASNRLTVLLVIAGGICCFIAIILLLRSRRGGGTQGIANPSDTYPHQSTPGGKS